MKGRLNTKNKLVRYGGISDATCVLCNNNEETIDHLFFKCEFSKHIWREILDIATKDYSPQRWDMYIDFIGKDWRGNGLEHILSKMCLAACVYSIWKERNNISFCNGMQTKERIIENIRRLIRDKRAEIGNIRSQH